MSTFNEQHSLIVLNQVLAERHRQYARWGDQAHPPADPVLLHREGGCHPWLLAQEHEIPTEARAKFLCQTAVDRGKVSWMHILVEELAEVLGATIPTAVRTELIQLAACCVAYVEDLDHRAANLTTIHQL